jgi:hypothetical protein
MLAVLSGQPLCTPRPVIATLLQKAAQLFDCPKPLVCHFSMRNLVQN